MKLHTLFIAVSVSALLLPISLLAQTSSNRLGSDPGAPKVIASPKDGWNALPTPETVEEPSTLRQVLLWLPNRVVDLFDIFRIDVGVGPAAGGVIRVSKYAQAGYRQMLPVSARVGLMGRRAPVMLENANELGVSPLYVHNSNRKVCPGEVGVGLDLFIAGGYAGICVDEVVDFFGGIFTLDPKDDDFK
jgi:hypothetical protein